MIETRPHQTRELDRTEALRLLGSVSFGRISFTERALPQIRPVNHLVDAGEVFIRTHSDAAVMTAIGRSSPTRST
ncbi:pyridoxamine 5'-phosphate oxidase family protein [Actinophytocola sp.]|uniref:pyridoxamine 5'-phosphate oxidase family protein n=1 Tax=Actinophytocola sp. TaxID=1872138 RepID=UPI0025BB129D|nr:pyridoxamine 5'-phosphate oxidase family protein [Actinophytocola sp.]